MSEYEQKAKELVSQHKYLQLSASWCPDCVYANSVWEKLGLQQKIVVFDIAQVSKDKQEEVAWRDAFERATGSRNLPTLYVDGQVWGTELELHAHEDAGTLRAELAKIGLDAQ
ncbi:AaceriAFR577Wp [[Ashbya] aceris (nom. inval.)]|nr:AaceriAFR577Wp [[Ashbya] aceris (nom. inval.)]